MCATRLDPGLSLFLSDLNDMPQATDFKLLLYTDDTCLIYIDNDTKAIDNQVKKDCDSLCDCRFIDNKLSIHIGEGKTKNILCYTKQHLKNQSDVHIRHRDTKIKQHSSQGNLPGLYC